MDFVVDTYVICKATQPFDDKYMSAISLLHLLMESPHMIALDAELFIETQYDPYIRRSPHLQPWWDRILFYSGNVSHYSGTCIKAVAARLDAMKFHKKDYAFVGVAHRANGNILVAEESDYTPEVRAYLASIGVRVVSIAEAVELVR